MLPALARVEPGAAWAESADKDFATALLKDFAADEPEVSRGNAEQRSRQRDAVAQLCSPARVFAQHRLLCQWLSSPRLALNSALWSNRKWTRWSRGPFKSAIRKPCCMASASAWGPPHLTHGEGTRRQQPQWAVGTLSLAFRKLPMAREREGSCHREAWERTHWCF